MRPSPLQLRHVFYTKVSVLRNPSDVKEPRQHAVGFDFEGAKIGAKVGTALRKGQDDDPRDFVVNLELLIDSKEGKPVPYIVDIGVVGVFNVLPSLPKEKRQDLIAVNGASILYGVIREIVLSLTSRFSAGPLTLPGMNFEDIVSTNRVSKSADTAPDAKRAASSVGTRKAAKKR